MSLLPIDWTPDTRTLRRFGTSMLVLGGMAAAFLYAREATRAAIAILAFAVAAGLPGLIGSRAALPLYRLWMAVAWAMNAVFGPVLLAAVYFGLITPLGLLMRVVGRDRLHLRRGIGKSYWCDLPLPPDSSRYERPY